MTATSTRRTVLAGAAALPALSLPVMAGESDPIFAAIERHCKAEAAYIGICNSVESDRMTHDEITAIENGPIDGLCYASNAEYAVMLAVTPTTPAGCAALLRHIEAYETKYAGEDFLVSECTESVRNAARKILSRIANTLEKAS
jgi:hypothetical protein